MQAAQNTLDLIKSEQKVFEAIVSFNYGEAQDVSPIVLNEISYLEAMSVTKPEILQCEPISIQTALKYVLKNNLTLDPNAGLVYTKTRNVAMQKDTQGNVTKWGKVLEVEPTCEGRISIAYQCASIIDHERPTIKKNDQGKVVEVSFRYLRTSAAGPRWCEISFDESDFKRWKDKSHAENSRGKADATSKDYSNINYRNFNGGPDPEFIRAKAIKHALKKLGTNPNARLLINAKPTLTQTVDPMADLEAIQDESPESDYIPFTEQGSDQQKQEGPKAEFNVTTHEKITIPAL